MLITKLPISSLETEDPGSTKTVVNGDSMIAGPFKISERLLWSKGITGV